MKFRKPSSHVERAVLDEISRVVNTPWGEQAVAEEERQVIARRLGLPPADPQLPLRLDRRAA